MDEHTPALDLQTATIRELLVELEAVEKERARSDCFRLRSRERAVCAELRLRREGRCPPSATSPAGGDDLGSLRAAARGHRATDECSHRR